METRADAIARGAAPERVWLIEHPPLYTPGTSAKDSDLVDARFPVHRTGRGGQFTYHGPGQRVAYVMLDLKRRRPDVRAYVASLEHWLIEALKTFDATFAEFQKMVEAGDEEKITALFDRGRAMRERLK